MRQPNILLIVLDSARAANMSVYDYKRKTTPFLAEIAEEMIVYQEARAPSGKSVSSHTSIFTGLHPEEHKITNPDRTLARGNTIWERLANEFDYETGVFSSNAFLVSANVGLKKSFQTRWDGRDYRLPFHDGIDPLTFTNRIGERQYQDFLRASVKSGSPIKSILNGVSLAANARCFPLPEYLKPNKLIADDYVRLFLQWQNSREGSWAACINLMDTHQPWQPLSEFDQWSNPDLDEIVADAPTEQPLWRRKDDAAIEAVNQAQINSYDGTIRQVDDAISKLIDRLKRRNEYENTLLVITADHGTGFGEDHPLRDIPSDGHGVRGGIHENILHVPLIVKPACEFEPKDIDQLASVRRFPDALLNAINNDAHEKSFVVNDWVLSSVSPLTHYAIKKLESHSIGNYMELTESGRVLYEQIDSELTKHVQWGDNYQSYVINDGERTAVEGKTAQRIDEIIDSLKQTNVRTDDTVPTGAAKQRLEELGYM